MMNTPNPPTEHTTHHPVNAHHSQAFIDEIIVYNHISYALYAFGLFTMGICFIIAIFMNYAKREQVKDSWLYSHFDWQIRTFWYAMFFGTIAVVMMLFGFGGVMLGMFFDSRVAMGGSTLLGGFGGLMLLSVLIWSGYRIVRGWIALTSKQALPMH